MLIESYLHTPLGKLNVARGPANGPKLLLLHGMSNRWQTFLPILPELTKNWQVIAFDHRGHGGSDRIDGPYSAAAFFQDARNVLDTIGPEPVALLGHSMGGSLALYLAEAFPEKVRAVITGDTSFNLAIHIDVMNSRRNTKLFGLRRKLAGRPEDELIRRGIDPSTSRELSLLDPHVMDFHAEGHVEGFFEGIQNLKFEKITCPLLLTQADPLAGGLLQDTEVDWLVSQYPHLHVQKFGCSHAMEIEKGMDSAFFQTALEFLQNLP